MRQGRIFTQVDGGTRHLYECPRGIIAIDEHRDGTREITRCLGDSSLTRRDEREARAMHLALLADEEFED